MPTLRACCARRPEIERVALGRFDGRCEERAVAHRAVFREREIEASRRTRNIRGIRSFVRYLTELSVKLGGGARGRRPGPVEEDDTVDKRSASPSANTASSSARKCSFRFRSSPSIQSAKASTTTASPSIAPSATGSTNPLADPEEASLAEALYHLGNGACSPDAAQRLETTDRGRFVEHTGFGQIVNAW